MKTLKLKFSFLLLFFMLFNANLSAETVVLDTDTFDSTTDGWGETGVSQNSGQLLIERRVNAEKTFTFPSLADETVTFSLDATEIGFWWPGEKLRIFEPSGATFFYGNIDGTNEHLTFSVTLDENGKIRMRIRPDTYFPEKKISIDNIIITYTYPQVAPNLTSDTFEIIENLSIGDFVGTVLVTPILGTPYAPSFSIVSGDTDSLFSIDNNGTITTTADLTTRSKDTYTLEIKATNAYGYDEKDITINIEDAPESNDGRDFEIRTQYNLFGDVKIIGNTVLCLKNSSGDCIESAHDISNDSVDLQKAPRSYSTLVLPNDSIVRYARLYWTGRKKNDDNWDSDSKIDAGKIQFKKGTSLNYTSVIADVIDFNEVPNSGDLYPIYSASADVLSIVNSDGTYDVNTESFYTITGATKNYTDSGDRDGLGTSGAWVLVVIYEDPNEKKARSITVFDGYKIVSNDNDTSASIRGFLTPKTGYVDSKVYIFAAEGDKFLSGTSDIVKMGGATYNTTKKELGTFDSRIDINATRYPNLNNNNGTDIHIYDVGTTSGAMEIITNNETGADFTFTTNADWYWPSLFVLSTELYLPQMCYDYSIKQDGSYLDVDRDAYPVARLDSTISSSPLEITVYLKNTRSDFAAEGIAIKSDVNESKFTQIGNIFTSNTNGSTLIDRGDPTFTSPLCDYDKLSDNSLSNNGCEDGHNIRKGLGSLDEGDYVYAKFSLSPLDLSGLVAVNEPLGLSLKYYITAGGNKIEYPDYILGSDNVQLCTTSNVYEPTWGMFNVVESGQPNNDIKNNIYTKISRNPFNVAVVFDSTTSTGDNTAPTSDINTTVLVEIIDMDAFGDINASCANPDSSLSSSIFTPINFTPSYFQTLLTPQPADYYNFAVKNASFRVWYFADSNGSLIQNWSVDVDTNNTNINAVYGLYQSQVHTVCEDLCIESTSVECFNCIRANYAQPICSRDNFSIRPESYNVKIFDIDHNASARTKDLTKYNISNQDGFDPGSDETGKTMNLAAGYNYRFDIDATGYNGLMAVPGYTRYFNGAPDYNATLKWNSSGLDCNDDSDHTLKFYIANGVMLNEEQSHSNVGKYKINLIDKSWTAVDYSNNTHQIADKSFDITGDCQINSTSTVALDKKYGCFISTDHGSDNVGNYYQDHKIEFYPYKFDITGISPSHGKDNNETFDTNTFIYMADMEYNSNQDQNMSFHLNGWIGAVGEDNSTLTNFVDNCYAKDINIKITRSNLKISTYADHRYVFHNVDISANYQNGSMNNLVDSIELDDDDFKKSNNGATNTILNLNFNKDISYAQNPETLTYTNYAVNCDDPADDCQMNADLTTDFQTKASMDLNQTITYLYARSYAPRYRYLDPTNQQALIYYEVYCDGTIDGNTCKKSLLPDGSDSNTTDDPRWFINTKHTNNAGTAGDVNQKGFAVNGGYVTQDTAPTGNHQDSVWITYDESKGYPYKTTMQLNSSKWLIYNKYNNSATVNEFEVEYSSGDTSWGGKAETNSTTIEGGANNTNRRYMW